MEAEIQKAIEELKDENKALKIRCFVFTAGTRCASCPFECDNRIKKYRGDQDAKEI